MKHKRSESLNYTPFLLNEVTSNNPGKMRENFGTSLRTKSVISKRKTMSDGEASCLIKQHNQKRLNMSYNLKNAKNSGVEDCDNLRCENLDGAALSTINNNLVPTVNLPVVGNDEKNDLVSTYSNIVCMADYIPFFYKTLEKEMKKKYYRYVIVTVIKVNFNTAQDIHNNKHISHANVTKVDKTEVVDNELNLDQLDVNFPEKEKIESGQKITFVIDISACRGVETLLINVHSNIHTSIMCTEISTFELEVSFAARGVGTIKVEVGANNMISKTFCVRVVGIKMINISHCSLIPADMSDDSINTCLANYRVELLKNVHYSGKKNKDVVLSHVSASSNLKSFKTEGFSSCPSSTFGKMCIGNDGTCLVSVDKSSYKNLTDMHYLNNPSFLDSIPAESKWCHLQLPRYNAGVRVTSLQGLHSFKIRIFKRNEGSNIVFFPNRGLITCDNMKGSIRSLPMDQVLVY